MTVGALQLGLIGYRLAIFSSRPVATLFVT